MEDLHVCSWDCGSSVWPRLCTNRPEGAENGTFSLFESHVFRKVMSETRVNCTQQDPRPNLQATEIKRKAIRKSDNLKFR